MEDLIDAAFPIRDKDGNPSYREGQKEGIEFIMNAFENDKDIVILEGPTGSGKCLDGDTLVLTSGGDRVKISQLGSLLGKNLHCLNSHLRNSTCELIRHCNSGRQECFLLETRSGRSITSTAKHRFLTITGWKKLCELTVGDYIAVNSLLDLGESDIIWDKIVSINCVGMRETYDIEVSSDNGIEPNFSANDIITHNSAIGKTVMELFDNSFYLTSTKILQDQLVKEFQDVVELKGRNAYPCNLYARYGVELVKRGLLKESQLQTALTKKPNCAEGFCKTKTSGTSRKSSCTKCFLRGSSYGGPQGDLQFLPQGMTYSACPYYEQVFQAINSRKVVMNFSSFLFQTQMTRRFDPPRDLLVIDECLHPHTRVQTEHGLIPIGKLVNDRMEIKVASYNQESKQIEFKPIVRWLKRDKKLTYRVLVGNRVLYPTSDHQIYTPAGKKKLAELKVGDDVCVYDVEITEAQKCKEITTAPILSIEPYKVTFNYDLEVADNHNYFAGNTLVSNCHNVEQQLMDFVSLTISDGYLTEQSIFIPELNSAQEYALWFLEVNIAGHLFNARTVAAEKDQFWLEEDLIRTMKKLKMFLDHIKDSNSEWVYEYEITKAGSRRVTLKPVFVHGLAEPLLFRFGRKVLLMSATILDVNVICNSLGIDRNKVAALRMKNRFPKENRPIYLETVGKLTGGKEKMREWGPDLIRGVDEKIARYEGKRGIIHTHSFAIQDLLYRGCSKTAKLRFLIQQDFPDKKALLEEHSKRTDSIILAPAMHEGIDLSNDLSRFQIICKIPYANCFDDPQLARRVEKDRRYYLWMTAIKLVQSYGRSIRSEVDYADTIILDESIHKFMRDAKQMLPSWFLEAIKT